MSIVERWLATTEERFRAARFDQSVDYAHLVVHPQVDAKNPEQQPCPAADVAVTPLVRGPRG